MKNETWIEAAAAEIADAITPIVMPRDAVARSATFIAEIIRRYFGESAPEQKEGLERVQRSGMFYHLIGPCPKCGKTLLLDYGHHSGKSRGRDNFKWTVMHEHNASAWCDVDLARFAERFGPNADTRRFGFECGGRQRRDTHGPLPCSPPCDVGRSPETPKAESL